ncbi:MAG: hypothetical protein LR017_00630 [Candidatus Pacebacteria bacterium]|nr:hypothetical protein [Candidatus Paceibacterota bacterium]
MKAILNFLEGFGVNIGWVLMGLGALMFYFIITTLNIAPGPFFGTILATAPLWLPIITFMLFHEAWVYAVRLEYDINQGRTTLEITLPQEVRKSPEAMELILNQLHQAANPDNHFQTYWDGKHAPVFSLELVSRGGNIHFYINTPRKKFMKLIENQLYAQYPGIEVKELSIDYTAEVPWDTDRFEYFAFHFAPKKADAYPIKTYVDYGHRDMPKEEEKIDPMTTMLDALGGMGPDEQMWVQIMITANKEHNFKNGSLKTVPDWKKDAQGEIKNIYDSAAKRSGGESPFPMLTDVEQDKVKSIERSLGKNAFDTNIRAVYIAASGKFNGDQLGAIGASWRAYDDNNKNNIGVCWRTDFDWNMWQDRSGKKKEAMKKNELNEYKRRTYTPQHKKDGGKVFTTEELATIYHLPGQVVLTPALGRIPSARSEAPNNLPV